MQLRRAAAAAALLAALAGPAGANPYETFISIDNEEDLHDLHATGQIDDDTLTTLVELYQRGVDLNRATREELYSLPNLTYAEVDAILEYRKLVGWIHDPIDLIVNHVLTQDKLEAIAAFLLVSDAQRALFATDGWVRSQTRWAAEDDQAPPVSLQARVGTFQNLTVGAAATVARNRIDSPVYDPSRGALTTTDSNTSVHVPKAYAKWETDQWGAIVGTYRIGFGQRLTFDNTSVIAPNGFYLDDELTRGAELTKECKESAGELGVSPCDGDAGHVYITPDYHWREGLLGAAVGAKKIPVGKGRVSAYGWVSYQPRSIYQYEIYNKATCDDPASDLDTIDQQCAAPEVYHTMGDPLDPTSRYSFQTLPNMFAETTTGGNVTFALSRRAHVGATGYRTNVTWLVDGEDFDLDFQEWSRLPRGGPFGAVGVDGAVGAGMFDYFAEVTRSFDSIPEKTPDGMPTEGGGGGGWGGVARWVTTFQKYNELEASVRYYDEHFKNPNARPIAAPDELDGARARDEMGARLKYAARLDKRLTLRAMSDVWQTVKEYPVPGGDPGEESKITDLLLQARGDVDVTDQYGVGLWGLYQNKDLDRNGVTECFDSSFLTDDETGEPIPCSGEKYQATARFRYTPTPKYTMVAQYQHELVGDGSTRYEEELRQDASASLLGSARPDDRVRLRGRVRYLVEGIGHTDYLEESVWGYADVTYRVRERDRLRVRYDIYVYLDERSDTDLRQPSPEHWLWLEYESRF